MASELVNQAVIEAVEARSAIAKFISPNDTKSTKSHQSGFYLPKAPWKLFSPTAPKEGENFDHPVQITWHDGTKTESVVKWYSKSDQKNEFRLTRFGRGFAWREESNVGDLLLLIPKSPTEFSCFVFQTEDDIEEVLANLGIDPASNRGWDVFAAGSYPRRNENECIEREFSTFLKNISHFPEGAAISKTTRNALYECSEEFTKKTLDDKLVRLCDEEFNLFRRIENKLYGALLASKFSSLDDFIRTANTVLNRRKSRAGRALENHVEYLLTEAKLPFTMRPNIDGRPDVVFPSMQSYKDPGFPKERLVILAVKSTCKDRWRQVLREGRRVEEKYLLTIQNSISVNQLQDMFESSVRLVIPKSLHEGYPKVWRSRLLSVEAFVSEIRSRIA